MEESQRFDLVSIGTGMGGYVAAIRATQLGLKAAVIEKEATLGGTCLNVGCIPSKALLESSELYNEAQHHFAAHGIQVGELALDLDTMMARKDKIVRTLTSGVEGLMRKNGIPVFRGHGRIVDPNTIEVKAGDGSTSTVKTERILIATGSTVAVPRGFTLDGDRIISSDDAIALKEVPKHLVIIGAGVIGVELGSVWRRLGAEVTLIELLPRILNGMDSELAIQAQRIYSKQGLKFILGAKVTSATNKGDEVEVVYELEGQSTTLSCDRLLVCVGRRPNTGGLGCEEVGIQLDRLGRVEVDDHFETTVKGIYAVGDVIRGPMLAHKAEEEGYAVAELIAGKAGHVNYDAIPNVVYTWPEIASVGKTEDELKEAGIDYKRGTFPFQPNGRAKAMGHTDGFVKILADAKTDRILGAHIMGPRAGDLLAELVLAIEFAGSSEDVARTSHAHPTLSEVIKEAALDVDKRRLHL